MLLISIYLAAVVVMSEFMCCKTYSIIQRQNKKILSEKFKSIESTLIVGMDFVRDDH